MKTPKVFFSFAYFTSVTPLRNVGPGSATGVPEDNEIICVSSYLTKYTFSNYCFDEKVLCQLEFFQIRAYFSRCSHC